MKPPPPSWPRISSSLYYEDPKAAIDFLCRAFGFEVRLLVPGENDTIRHSELTFGEGVVMIASPKPEKFPRHKPPPAVGGANTQNMMVYVDDVEAHFARAKGEGAVVLKELATTDHGPEYWSERGYECLDPGGHAWWFYQRLRNPPSSR